MLRAPALQGESSLLFSLITVSPDVLSAEVSEVAQHAGFVSVAYEPVYCVWIENILLQSIPVRVRVQDTET